MGKKNERREGRYVNLMIDVAFKRVFGQEANKDLLAALLNSVLPELNVSNLKFLDKEKFGFWRKAKKSVFDVLCENAKGEKIIVEMQVLEQADFKDRTVYYASQEILSQHKEGDKNYKLYPVYVVSFTNFLLGHDTVNPGQVVWKYSLREDNSHELMTDALHFTYVELARFDKSEGELANMEERFYFCLKYIHKMTGKPGSFIGEVFEKLFEVAEVAGMNESEYKRYKASMTTKADIRNSIEFAKKQGIERGLAEGLAEGLEKGLAEGREKGLAEGREKGLAEGRAEGIKETVLANAKNLKELGVDISIISKATGLEIKDIEAL